MRDDTPTLADLQRTMVQAVHANAEAFDATAENIVGAGGDPRKRLFLHLNTINHALIAVLRQAYPATADLLGDARFEAAAKVFVHAHPPTRPVLSEYGAGFDEFLIKEGVLSSPVEAVARLDWAAHTAYFAKDALALSGAAMARMPPEDHASLRLSPVPSLHLVPVTAIGWARWRELADPATIDVEEAIHDGVAAGVIWRRPDHRLAAHGVGVPERIFLETLFAGGTLVAAAEEAGGPDGFDLSGLLSVCLAGGVFRALDVCQT
jgi:hypothetical protein